MFLKISKRPIRIRCDMKKGSGWRMITIGTTYAFSLVESCRSGKKIGHKIIENLGSIAIKDYEPLHTGMGVNGFGVSCKKVYVKSFALEDVESFRKVRPDPPVRFYHTFTGKLWQAAVAYDISHEQLQKFTAQVQAIIPLYSEEDYCRYMRMEVQEKIREELSEGYGKDLDKLIGREAAYNIYDYVVLRDGILCGHRNILKVKVEYGFELM